MSDIQFYICDTETNGLNVSLHEIWQLSVIRVKDRTQFTKNIRVHNAENSSFDALKIVGKTIGDLRKGSEKLDTINEFEEFISEDGVKPSHRALICHNVSFDRRFLWALWEKYNRSFPFNIYIDTIAMWKSYCKKQGYVKQKSNLVSVVEALGIKKYGSHNASDDTRHTYFLWEKLNKELDWLEFAKCLPHNLEL